MLDVQIVLFDGFDLMDALAPYEVFCAAEMLAGGSLNVDLVTGEGPRLVPSGTNGLKIEAAGKLDPERAGIILVPGASGDVLGDGPNSVPSILTRAMNTELTGMIRQALEREETIVATVCGGSLILAMGGLLEGRPAVTNRLGMELLGATGAIPVAARVVDDGNLITGGGVTSGLDVALYLVERELGPRLAHAVEQLFEYEKRGTVWRGIGIAPDADPSTSGQKPVAVPDRTESADVIRPSGNASESVFEGEWGVIISTPVGKLPVTFRISTANGTIRGTATQDGEVSEFLNPRMEGNVLCWSQRITKPMRLNLKFEVSVSGDRLTGTAKAGLLPASKVNGTRV